MDAEWRRRGGGRGRRGGRARRAAVAAAGVRRVAQQRRVVGAHIQADGQAGGRVHPRRGGVQLDLALADAHAACRRGFCFCCFFGFFVVFVLGGRKVSRGLFCLVEG